MITHWVQKDGTEILIKDMTVTHIQNCIKMLNRKIGDDVEIQQKLKEAEEQVETLKERIKEIEKAKL